MSTVIPIAVSCLSAAVASTHVTSTHVASPFTPLRKASTATVTTSSDESDASSFSVEVTVPDYKPTATSTPSEHSEMSSKNSSPAKTNSQYHQLNIAVLGISTRLARVQDGIFSRLNRIESHLANMSGVSMHTVSTSTSTNSIEELLSGLDGEISASEDFCYLFGDTEPTRSSVNNYTTLPRISTCVSSTNVLCNLSAMPTAVTSLASNYATSHIPVVSQSDGYVSSTSMFSSSPMPISASLASIQPAINQSSGCVSSTNVNTSSTENFLGLTTDEITKMKVDACSRRNFATKSVKRVFSEEERRSSNCRGKRGKNPLDPIRLNAIKALTYYHFPLKPGLSAEDDWLNECVKAIMKRTEERNNFWYH